MELHVDGRGSPRLSLRLYVAEGAPNSRLARANLEAVLEDAGVADYALEIIDCIRDPHRVLRDGVLVTPTLVKAAPHPLQVIVGTLSDRTRVAAALGLPLPAGSARATSGAAP